MKTQLKIFLIAGLIVIAEGAFAQLNPLGSTYYQNEYLYNPSRAGIDRSLKLNTAIRAQWTNINGGPKTEIFTADYGFSDKVGGGILLYNEQAGVFQRSRVLLSYAYHLPLDGDSKILSFGISGGVMYEWVDRSKVIGDLSDESINGFNNRPLYLDADIGMTYNDDHLTVQFSAPNLKRFLRRDVYRNTVDLPIFYSSISYKIKFENSQSLDNIEPKLTFRKVQGFSNILDVGTQFSFSDQKLLLNAQYHTTKSLTIGAGTTYKESLGILALYTTNTAYMGNYSNGEFELALKYSFR